MIRRSAAFASLVFVPVFVLVSGCTKNNPSTPATPAAPAAAAAPAQTCACIFPLAPQCESSCHLTEFIVVQAAGPNQVIGRAVDQNNKQAAEDHVIPIDKLPAKQMQQLKPGSRIQVITRMEHGKPVITSLHVVSEPAAK